MSRERIINYYPQVIQSIKEFQAIVDSEYPEFKGLDEGRDRVINDAYLTTMSEQRVEQWENILGIKPLANSSLSDRRDTIIARIRGQGKLNSTVISSIVNAFTGGTAKSYIEDSTLYVTITPPPGDKKFQFENVEHELYLKVPAHLGFSVTRNYQTWNDLMGKTTNWEQVRTIYNNWESVIYNSQKEGLK